MTSHTYRADQTALLIVDPYNDFMTEGGKLHEAIRPTAEASGMYDNLRTLIPAARASKIQIFILPHHQSHDGDFDHWEHQTPFQKFGSDMKAFERGSWGAQFNPEFGPQQGDIIIKEHWAQSSFANTDLDFHLKQRGIRNIILVGLIANSCIEATARFGVELGYHVTMVPDATAAFSPEGMKAAFEVNGPTFVHAITKTGDLIKQFSGAPAVA